VDHSEKIRHHLGQLKKKGLIYPDSKGHSKVAEPEAFEINEIFNLPIMGLANCGTACELAYDNIQGYLKVSPRIVGRKNPEGLFVVKAVGNSLNRAEGIGAVEDGDYVIVDLKNRNPRNGEYVLSIIDDAANLKRFYQEKGSNEIRLVSESTKRLPPIVIHRSDFETSKYMINGVVLKVIKN
jgi:SOS-response transcriptional repressor LexA